jgi:hypothetical protein
MKAMVVRIGRAVTAARTEKIIPAPLHVARGRPPNACTPSAFDFATFGKLPPTRQRWQLGDVARYASSFIKRQPLSGFSIALIGVTVHISQALSV